jgi:hypothetical protein
MYKRPTKIFAGGDNATTQKNQTEFSIIIPTAKMVSHNKLNTYRRGKKKRKYNTPTRDRPSV